jgi:hypothetical protein
VRLGRQTGPGPVLMIKYLPLSSSFYFCLISGRRRFDSPFF